MDKFSIDIEIVEINEMPVPVSEEESDTSTETKDYATLSKALPGYHLFIKAHLDSEEIELVVDTGASKTVLDPSLSKKHIELSKNDDSIQSMSVNAELEIGFGFIKSFRLGEIEHKDMPVGFTSLEAVNQMYETIIGKRIWGLLGSDFLMEHGAVIDYGAKSITLTKP